MVTSVSTTTKLTCNLTSGKTVELTPADCVAIINTMSRRRMLTIAVEDVPQGYSYVWSDECCAWGGEDGNDDVTIAVNAADYVYAEPIERSKAAKKVAGKRAAGKKVVKRK
jgi:hypothetical protein